MKPRHCGVVLGIGVASALWLSPPCHAQSRGLRFDHLTVEDGLSNSWVHAIIKDSRGFVWFGTDDGLNRYDGGGIKVYRHDPKDPHSLPSPVVAALVEDGKKRLWVASGWGKRGVARYDRERDRFERFLPNGDQPTGNDVRALIADRQGQLWLGTDNGVARLDPDSGAMKRFPRVSDERATAPEASVLALLEDRQGRLWVGTGDGLSQFDRETGRYSRWSKAPETAITDAVMDLLEDEDGGLWVATLGGGLYCLDANAGRATRYLPDARDPNSISHAGVRRLAADGKGRLYVGTENGGLNVLDLRTRRFTSFLPDPEDDTSLRSASIWSMCFDDQGILWLGTYLDGVDYLSPLGQRFQRIRARRGGLSDPHVIAAMEDHLGNLWIGTDGGGLNKLDGKSGTFTHYRHDPKDPTTIGADAVGALLEDSEHNVWIGGWGGGLGRIDPASGRVTRFRHDPRDPRSLVSDRVWRILELSTGELLVVTHVGADLFDRRTRVFTRLTERYPGAGEGALFNAAEDKDGRLWLVGNVFVGVLDRRTRRVQRYRNDPQDPNSLGAGWTEAVQIDSAGNVWLGTQGGLTCIAAGTGKLRRYTTEDGLPNNAIRSIAEDSSGNLWLGTNRGLSKLANAVQVPDQPKFLSFDVHDGLQGYEFARNAAFHGRSGRVFFGGSRGLNWFIPEQIQQNPHAPTVVFTDLRVFNHPTLIGAPGSPLTKSITETSALTLSYRDSVVTFEFAALDFVLPQKNRYSYKLEGFDKDWTPWGPQHAVTYTNLPYQSFTLLVRATNNDGVQSSQPAALKIRVKPPFWRAGWFYFLLAVALAAAVVWGVRLRLRAIEARGRELEAKVEERTNDLQTERDLLGSLMDNIPDHIYFKDTHGRYVRINQAYATGLGLASPQDAIGKTDADFHAADSAAASRADEEEIVRSAKPLLGKVERDGRSAKWYLATKVPIRDASGAVTGLVGISKDITERREAEERLRGGLETFRAFVTEVASGDLTQRAQLGEETLAQIAQFVNQMLDGFTSMLSEVRDAAFSVSTASSEILATSSQIAKAAQHGRDQVYGTTSAVEQMATSMHQIAQSAEASAEAAQQVMERLTASDRDVDVAVQGMNEIDAAVSGTAEKMRLLGERSGEIFAITDLIEDIAGRSELLSLNAAIEAAHAGDAGRGFAVVAEEIRNLAERSTAATKDVATIVKGMTAEMSAVLSAMEDSTLQVKKGLSLSQHAREGLREISVLVERAAGLAGQISGAAHEQLSANQTVSQAMQAIMNVTEESTAATAETRKAVQDLVSLSETLTRVIARFKIESPDAFLRGQETEDARSLLARLVERVQQLERALAAGSPGAASSSASVRALSSDLERLFGRVQGETRG